MTRNELFPQKQINIHDLIIYDEIVRHTYIYDFGANSFHIVQTIQYIYPNFFLTVRARRPSQEITTIPKHKIAYGYDG